MIVIEDCDNVIFMVTSIRKVMLAKKWDVNDCKIKVSKNFTQSKKLRWIIFNWYLTNATLSKHLLLGTWRGVTFNSLLVTRWNLLVAKFARYLLQLLIAKSHSLLVGEVAHCKKSLVTCRKIRSLPITEIVRYKKSLVTRCKICLLLVAEYARCKISLVTHYEKTPGTYVYLKPIKIGEFYLFIIYFQLTKNRKIPYATKLASQKYIAI